MTPETYRKLMRERGQTIRKTAERAGMGYETLTAFLYRKNPGRDGLTERTIRGLCRGVGISLGEWFKES